jgi:DNA-binding transcriptional LysR family regulator
MTHTQLRVFLAILDAGSLSGAALDLGIAQSSVSRAIAELERDLGTKLLHRGRQGARPTEVGQRIVTHARSVLDLHATIRQETSLARGPLRGHLHISAYPSIVRQLVAEVIVAFGERYPEVEIDLTEAAPTDVEDAVRDGLVDVGFSLLPTLDELIAFEVDSDPCLAVVPTDWHSDQIEQHDLANTPFLVYGDAVCERVILGYMRDIVGPMEPAHRLRENATIVDMIAKGLGISIMTASAFSDHDGVRGLPLLPPLNRVTGAMLRPQSLSTPTVHAFLALLRERGLITSRIGEGDGERVLGRDPAPLQREIGRGQEESRG